MKIKNFKINEKFSSKLATCVLVGTLTATTLTGCETIFDRNLNTVRDRAMVSIGNEYFAFDIDGYEIYQDSHTELTLTDGTSVILYTPDLQLYNKQSEIMQNIENSAFAIQTHDSDNSITEEDYDKALVQFDDTIMMLEISEYDMYNSTSIVLTLTDGTSLCTHPTNLILFNSKSSIMKQVQEKVLNSDNSKTKQY